MATYLRQRRLGYYARVRVPPSLKHVLGHAIEVSLKTRDAKVAERKKHAVVGAIKERIERVRRDLIASPSRTSFNVSDPRALLSVAAQLHEQVEAGTLDYDTAAELLSTKLEEQREHLGEKDDDEVDAARIATYRTSFKTLAGTVGLTLGRAIDQFDEHQTNRGVRASTVKAQVRLVRLFLGHCGDRPVAEVTRRHAAAWATDYLMKLERAIKTKLDGVVALTAFFNYLARRGEYDARNPFEGVADLIRGSKRTEKQAESYRPWTADELAKLATLAADAPLRGVALLSLYGGLRTEEAASMLVADVHIDDAYIVVRDGKNPNARRYVPIHSATIEPLRAHVERAVAAGREQLFDLAESSRDGKRAPNLRAYRWMAKTFGADKDATHVIYSLRHTFATALERAGVDQTMRSRLLGHVPSDLATSTYSAGPLLVQMREAVEKIAFGSFTG